MTFHIWKTNLSFLLPPFHATGPVPERLCWFVECYFEYWARRVANVCFYIGGAFFQECREHSRENIPLIPCKHEHLRSQPQLVAGFSKGRRGRVSLVRRAKCAGSVCKALQSEQLAAEKFSVCLGRKAKVSKAVSSTLQRKVKSWCSTGKHVQQPRRFRQQQRPSSRRRNLPAFVLAKSAAIWANKTCK